MPKFELVQLVQKQSCEKIILETLPFSLMYYKSFEAFFKEWTYSTNRKKNGSQGSPEDHATVEKTFITPCCAEKMQRQPLAPWAVCLALPTDPSV